VETLDSERGGKTWSNSMSVTQNKNLNNKKQKNQPKNFTRILDARDWGQVWLFVELEKETGITTLGVTREAEKGTKQNKQMKQEATWRH
jgi:hypothetical protein